MFKLTTKLSTDEIFLFQWLLQVTHPDQKRDDIPPVEKLPTNQFIEGLLGTSDNDDLEVPKPQSKESERKENTPNPAEPLPDEQDDLESVLDIKGDSIYTNSYILNFIVNIWSPIGENKIRKWRERFF